MWKRSEQSTSTTEKCWSKIDQNILQNNVASLTKMLLPYFLISLFLTLTNAQENNIRLVGGSMSRFGRVEVLYNGKWGTVCDNGWDLQDAQVVCRSLGFGRALEAVSGAGFGRGSGPVFFDEVSCSGNEKDIFECGHAGLGTTSCGHVQDAGVRCAQYPAANIRLVGGSNPTEGRVEVLVNGTWGTVCDDFWDNTDAEVVCQSLGFAAFGIAVVRATFGEGTGPIWMDDTLCAGGEINLLDCPHIGPEVQYCGHHEDAGVQCDPASTLRLVGGSSRLEGRVEMLYNGQWGSLCTDQFGREEANIVCRRLGLGYASNVFYRDHFGQSNLANVYKFNCEGFRSSILRCGEIGVNNCRYGRNAGIRCHEGILAPTRLAGGPSLQEGRVEVLYNGVWGTICDHDWTVFNQPARVVCFSIGLGSAIEPVSGGRYEESSGPMVLDDVFCYGSEHSITQCESSGFGVGYCGHSAEAGVRCSRSPQASIRLTGGQSIYEGRVEVLYQAQWASVCDDGWDLTDANVVCRTLGYGPALEAVSYAGFGQGRWAIALDEVNCTGDEDSIYQCPNLGIGVHNCGHGEDAGVRCSPGPFGSVRVVNGSSRYEGRVEVFYDGKWGTVCDDLWDNTDASVVCRMLGLGDSGTAVGCSIFGDGSGNIVLDNVRCLGNETDLFSCPSNRPFHHDCTHLEDAGVRCHYSRNIRLVDGTSNSNGRIEVLYNGTWGTVCDDRFDMNGAYIACRSLGFNYALEVVTQAGFGMGTGPVILDDVRCYGPEESLFQCQNNGPLNANCGHWEDAGVRCSRSTSTSTRLVNGETDRSGRVEIFFNGHWGTVCHDGWDNADATVVCRRLGLGNDGIAHRYATFGEGTGDIILSNLRCTGQETDLMACPSTGPLNNRCLHFQDAGVTCR